MIVVRQKSSGLFLRMSKFDPDTQQPVYGPLEQAWIADSEEQAKAQASFLGDGENHEAVHFVFATSDTSRLANLSKHQIDTVLQNTKIHRTFIL